MKKLSRLVWFGQIADENLMLNNAAYSPAANQWQGNLLAALEVLGISVSVIGHYPERVWPYGRLRFLKTEHRVSAIPVTNTSYWNVPYLRTWSLKNGYLKKFHSSTKQHDLPDVVCTYNATPYNLAVGQYIQNEYDIPWICIVADSPDQGKALEKPNEAIALARGRVFLPWWNYSACTSEPKLHFDGGVSETKFMPSISDVSSKSPPVILYSGSLEPRKGINLLIDAFQMIQHTTAEMWICGKGSNDYLENMAKSNSRIKLYGLVPFTQLENLRRQADLFVNPRDSSVGQNSTNFPSKLLEYLSYGKPIISTKTLGVSPEYDNFLVYLETETPECLANTIDEVLAWDDEHLNMMQERAINYIANYKQWDIQATRLVDWINTEVLSWKK